MAKEKFRRVSEVEFDLDTSKDLNFTFTSDLGDESGELVCFVAVKHVASGMAMPPPSARVMVSDVLTTQEMSDLEALLAKLASAGVVGMGMIK